MTTEELIIAAVRVAGPLRCCAAGVRGVVVAILIDFSDLFMMNLLNLGGVQNYQAFDKWLDLTYMATFLWVAWRWQGSVRTIAVALFAYRILGVLAFEALGSREVLLAFPNVFEFWFVFVAGVHRFAPGYEFTMRRSLLWLVPVTLLKGVPGVRTARGAVARQLPGGGRGRGTYGGG